MRAKTHVGNHKNVITLNGKLYDAKTGALFAHPLPTKKPTEKVIDGFIVSKKSSHKVVAKPEPPKPSPHHQTKHVVAHRPEKPKTLMRSVVRKPYSHIKPGTKAPDITPDSTFSDISSNRLHRAKKVSKSQLISRFGDPISYSSVQKTEAVQAKPLPKVKMTIDGHDDSVIEPSLPQQDDEPTDIFATALSEASSHQQPALKHVKRQHRLGKKVKISKRAISTLMGIFTVIALGGFITFQNIPNLQMRLAASKAGISASLPDYKPSGFNYKGIQTAPGNVTVSFTSNSDQRNFAIAQAASNWNSATLKETYLAHSGKPFQEHEDKGKTVFLYGDSNATWVDSGIWYKIEGDSSLSSDQLLQIADSF